MPTKTKRILEPYGHLLPSPEKLAKIVFSIRGEKIMLDTDLAAPYGVEASALNQAVARNPERFPEDFMFQLSQKSGPLCGHKL